MGAVVSGPGVLTALRTSGAVLVDAGLEPVREPLGALAVRFPEARRRFGEVDPERCAASG